ncbi:MAG: 6-phosphogluconolactonase [Chlorobiaceae bacterium]|nr:6-phosphogluconolactonase [Chlorobiaceae bacterium]
MTHWISAPHEVLPELAAAFITDRGWQAAGKRGRFTLVLAGGNTPRDIYRKLAEGVSEERYRELGYTLPKEFRRSHRNPEAIMLPWSQTQLFMSDERYLPPSHPQSNYGMIRETLLRHTCIKPENIHRMPTASGDPDADARQYEKGLATHLDLILLGLGDDGHTASLFPDDSEALKELQRRVIAINAPNGNPPGIRLTLTLPAINKAANVIFLIPSSRYELARSISNGEKPELPAGKVKPGIGDVWWFVEWNDGKVQLAEAK